MENKKCVIETERLILREHLLDDAERVAKLCNNKKIYENTISMPYPYTTQDAIDWINYQKESYDPERALDLAITIKESEELIGCIGMLFSKLHNHCDVGYWIGEDYWNNGYATEALTAVIEYLFEERNIHRVHSEHFSFNPASGRVMEKSGMKKEGTLVEHILKNGKYIDVVKYGIVNK